MKLAKSTAHSHERTAIDDRTAFDERTARVMRAFHLSGYRDLQRVDVTPTDEGVRLSGNLRTYYLKQIAQSLAMTTAGIDRVYDETEVR